MSLSSVSRIISAVLPTSFPAMPVRATLPITVSATSSLLAMYGIKTSAGPSSICRRWSLMANSSWNVSHCSR
ncbi:hypothetical protein D3C71_2066510 [compost metagenome]